jgi:hypothetical protein
MYNPVMIGETADMSASSADTSQLSDVSAATTTSNEVGDDGSTESNSTEDAESGSSMSNQTIMYIGLGLLAYFLLFRKK